MCEPAAVFWAITNIRGILCSKFTFLSPLIETAKSLKMEQGLHALFTQSMGIDPDL